MGDTRREAQAEPGAQEGTPESADRDRDCVGEIGIGYDDTHAATEDRTEDEPDHRSPALQVRREENRPLPDLRSTPGLVKNGALDAVVGLLGLAHQRGWHGDLNHPETRLRP
jgi:hypothetical protein